MLTHRGLQDWDGMVVALVSSMVECDFCEEALVDLNNLYKDVNKINVIKHQGDEEKKPNNVELKFWKKLKPGQQVYQRVKSMEDRKV